MAVIAFAGSGTAHSEEPSTSEPASARPAPVVAAPALPASTGRIEIVVPDEVIESIPRIAAEVKTAVGDGLRQATVEIEKALRVAEDTVAQATSGASASVAEAARALPNVRFLSNSSGAGSQSIVRFTPAPDSFMADMTMDLAVLSKVVQKSVGDQLGGGMGMGTFVSALGGSSGSVQATYVEGFGVLCSMSVVFPLAPGAGPAPALQPPAPPTSLWDRTLLELRSADDPMSREREMRLIVPSQPTEPYDAGKVEWLKASLRTILQESARLRGLGPDEWIAIVVRGVASPGGDVVTRSSNARIEHYGTTYSLAGRVAEGPSSVLTMRVRKRELDEFAAGRLTEDFLEERMQTAVY